MAGAASKYTSEEELEGGDAPLKVSIEAGRKCVRNIHQYPVMTPEWLGLVDSLKQLYRLVQIEARMPANEKVLLVQGRDAESTGTLWDQASHETAIRILVEEAKVNLCIRMMSDFKQWQYAPAKKVDAIAQATRDTKYSEHQLETKILHFEEYLGFLLRKAFIHVETLQLIDVRLLTDYSVMVLQHCQQIAASGELKLGEMKTQETFILYYVAAVFKHAEALNNAEVLAEARTSRLVHLAADHLLTGLDMYPMDIVIEMAEGFAALADNENFGTDWESYFAPPFGDLPDVERFLMIEEKVTGPIIEADPSRRKVLRPLLDMFNKLKRTFR